jgi:hypothetical protein
MTKVFKTTQVARIRKFLTSYGACESIKERFLESQEMTSVRVEWFITELDRDILKQIFPLSLYHSIEVIKNRTWEYSDTLNIQRFMENNLMYIYRKLTELKII